MKKILHLFFILIAFLSFAHAQVDTVWSTKCVVPGERAFFSIFIPDGQITDYIPPKMEGASIRPVNNGFVNIQGAPNFFIKFEVVADKPGTVTIPSITLNSANGKTYHTSAATLTVVPFGEVKWHDVPGTNGQVKYGTLWYVPNKSPYINQLVTCEFKLYAIPEIVNYLPPDIQKNGLISSSFEPAKIGDNNFIGTALIQGRDWNVLTLYSSFYPLRAGEISMSGKIIGNALSRNQDPIFAQFTQNYTQIPMLIPEIKMTARDFPPGAPKGFKSAVGQFTVKTTTKALDLTANDPVIIDITVEGTGNINNIECPVPEDNTNWKLYPATKVGDTAYTASGTRVVRFQQSIRPVQEVNAVPSFSLSFFNPETGQYHTASSAAIPLPWKQTDSSLIQRIGGEPVAPPPAGIVPVDKMGDIYGLVPASVISSLPLPESWSWYLLAYIPFLIILAFYIRKKIRENRARSAESRARWETFRQIEKQGGSTNQFLRALGTFIESRIPHDAIDGSLQDILKQRDAQAFLPEGSGTELTSSQRASMLKTIKKVLHKLPLILLGLIILGAPAAWADPARGEELYLKGEMSQAVDAFSQSSPDIRTQIANYYGMGNSLYRLNKPGEAALAYRRALNLCPGFIEARRNLEFIERKEGAIMPVQDSRNEWLTFVPKSCLMPSILVSGAVFLTALALLLIYRRYSVLLSVISVLALLATIAGIVNLAMYPDLPATINQNRLLIATEATPARHAADKDSPSLMTIPPSTPLILEAERGSWYYVRTFTGTPAWIETKSAAIVGQPQP